jgi:hypothetical protein
MSQTTSLLCSQPHFAYSRYADYLLDMATGGEASGFASKGPLPPDKPNLHEFKYPNEPIEWIKRLDDPNREGHRAFVYQVRIKSQDYALKVVSKDTVILLALIY